MKLALDLGRKRLRKCIGNLENVQVVASSYRDITGETMVRKDLDVPHDHFIIEKCPWDAIEGRTIVKEGAYSFFPGHTVESSNEDKKYDQDATYLNAAYGLATSLLYRTLGNDEQIGVGLCIPTGEFYSADSDLVKDRLVGSYSIFFPVLNRRVSFKLQKKDIVLMPEGVVALYPMLKTSYRDAIRSSNVMVVDAGHGSLDITIVKKMNPQGASSRSYPESAGTLFETMVAGALEKENFSSSEEAVEMAISEGKRSFGSSSEPVGELITRVRQQYANEVKSAMLRACAFAKMSPKDINMVFPVGRGFVAGGTFNTPTHTGDLASMLVENWTVPIELIQLPEVSVKNTAISLKANRNRIDERESTSEYLSKYEIANLHGVSIVLKSSGN